MRLSDTMPVWIKYRRPAEDQTYNEPDLRVDFAGTPEEVKKVVDRLEERGIYLKTFGGPDSGKYKAFNAAWRLIGMGTLPELIDKFLGE